MLDDLRGEASDLFDDEEAEFDEADDFGAERAHRRTRAGRGGRFLGMTPAQRFVIATLLLMLTSVLSCLILLVTEKVMLL